MGAALSTDTRSRILDAAIGIVADEGGNALTVRKVAAAAGCSTMGVYTHFTDKSGLLEAVMLDGFAAFGEALASADEIPDARERLIRSAVAYRRWALANTTRYLVMFTPLVPGFSPREPVLQQTGAVLDAHRARVEYAMAQGAIGAGSADAVAHHLWAVVHGHVMLELLRGEQDGPPRESEFEAAMVSLFDGLA